MPTFIFSSGTITSQMFLSVIQTVLSLLIFWVLTNKSKSIPKLTKIDKNRLARNNYCTCQVTIRSGKFRISRIFRELTALRSLVVTEARWTTFSTHRDQWGSAQSYKSLLQIHFYNKTILSVIKSISRRWRRRCQKRTATRQKWSRNCWTIDLWRRKRGLCWISHGRTWTSCSPI